MSITFVSVGAVANALGAITPVAGSYQTGDLLIYATGERFGTDNISTPVGWTLLSADNTVTAVKLFGKFAASTSETIPTVNWGASNRGFATVLAFRGVDTGFTTLATGGERSSNVTLDLVGPSSSRTPSADGCLIVFLGSRNKTSTTDGVTYSAPSGFTMATQLSPNGTSFSMGVSYSIQSTATLIPANVAMTGSFPAEGASQTLRTTSIYLAPAPPPSGGGGTGTTLFPPSKRKTYVFYDNYYPR